MGSSPNKKIRIVQLLSDGRFHSGEEIAALLSVSRTAVWKQLQEIRSLFGLEIFAVRGRGYRLSEPMELLDGSRILENMSAAAGFRLARLDILDSIGSTNRYLMERDSDGMESGHVCLAEQQTSGRGRRGRTWISPCGQNIYLSIHWRYALEMASLSGLSLAAGVAVARCLEGLGIAGLGLKWPNDLHWQGRKLAGLLMEASGEQGGVTRIVLGLGLNVKMREEPSAAIDQPWVSLSQIPEAEAIGRNHLAAMLIDALLDGLERFQREGLEPLIKYWDAYDDYRGRRVSLSTGIKQISGIHRGINADGALLLEAGGHVRAYYGGEVSLRKAES